MIDQQQLQEAKAYWDGEAPTFDNEPDHGLLDPVVYEAWRALLAVHMPLPPSRVLDIGCGTGSLSVLLSRLGHSVTGIDLSPAMIDQAIAKAKNANQQIEFAVMDAAYPQLAPRHYDVVLCRHILWSLPRPSDVLQRWQALLSPNGRFVLIEGYWSAGGGLHAHEVLDALPKSTQNPSVIDLSSQPDLWGGEVADERYLVVANSIGRTQQID